MNPRGIDHIGITVPDLDAATRFLAEAFDARTIYDSLPRGEPPQEGSRAQAMLGLTGNTSVVAIRLVRLGNGAGIELFEARKPDQASPIGVGDLGIHNFAIYCDDLDDALGRALAAGAIALAGPNALTGVEAGDGNRMNYVRAPWGTLIELITYPSGVADRQEAKRWTPATDQ